MAAGKQRQKDLGVKGGTQRNNSKRNEQSELEALEHTVRLQAETKSNSLGRLAEDFANSSSNKGLLSKRYKELNATQH